MDALEKLASGAYFGNELRAWIGAAVSFALWFTVLPLVRAFIGRRLTKPTAERPVTALLMLRTLVDATTRLFMLAVAVYLAMRWLEVADPLDRIIRTALLFVVWFQVGLWGSAAIRHLIELRRGHELASTEGAASINILRFVGTMVIWIVACLMLLSNLGVRIMPLVAGLGIGGIAVALAVQNLLGDLFASLSIALDKPFKVGDFLVIGNEKGTVERIGIQSTRLRSLSGEQIVMSNGDILRSRVRNYGLLYERRAVFTIRIVYETPRALLSQVSGIIESAIRAQSKTRFERAHFASFSEYALAYEAVYFVLDAEYNTYMDIQQAINLRLVEEFAERGIEFAYPTNKQFSVTAQAMQEGN